MFQLTFYKGLKVSEMESLSDGEWEHLEVNEITVFDMYITWAETMNEFQMYSESISLKLIQKG